MQSTKVFRYINITVRSITARNVSKFKSELLPANKAVRYGTKWVFIREAV